MPDTFQLAVVRAKAQYTTGGGWLSLSLTEQCHAIYLELRRLDKEQLKSETAAAAD
jgi:hypothetical protein